MTSLKQHLHASRQAQPGNAEPLTHEQERFLLSVRLLVSKSVFRMSRRLQAEDTLLRDACGAPGALINSMIARTRDVQTIERLYQAAMIRQIMESGMPEDVPLDCVLFDDTTEQLLAKAEIRSLGQLLNLNYQELMMDKNLPPRVIMEIQTILGEADLQIKPLPMK